MHRSSIRFLLLAGFAIATAAAAAPAGTAPLVTATPVVDHLMVWEVPEEVSLTGSVALRVEVLRRGNPIHSEAFTVLVPPHAEGGAVEILATEPEKRALFAGLAESGGAPLEVRITRGGEELARLLVSALLARGTALDTRPVELLPLRYDSAGGVSTGGGGLSAIITKGTDCSARNACRQACWDDYFACVDRFCPEASGSRFLPPECSFCEDDRRQCELNCPGCVCTEPKSVTYSTYVEPVSASWAGSGCFSSAPGYPGHDWDKYWVEYKFTKYKNTEACDGTVTTTVDSVWYDYGYCWEQRSWFNECPYPVLGTPSPRC